MGCCEQLGRGFTDNFNMISGMLRSFWNDPSAWEGSIRTFEAQDRRNPPEPGQIVFAGSSSFTFWKTLARDMAPLPVINRGFGGARMQDVIRYVDRVVLPYRPRAVVLFAGTNDIAWPRPASARQVCEGYVAFVERIQRTLPECPIYFVSITPAPSRWKYWPIANEANCLVREHTRLVKALHFIDLTAPLLGCDGMPDASLYRLDRLHPNARGYAVWTAVIKPILEADLLSV